MYQEQYVALFCISFNPYNDFDDKHCNHHPHITNK